MTTVTLDPVCGTALTAEATTPSLTYRGIAYRFCSAQCRERFQATPALYTGARRSAEIQPMPKQRRLRLAAGTMETLRQAEQCIARMKGVQSVTTDSDSLRVDYDLRIVALVQIERALAEAGIVLRQGLHGWRRALWRFAESNESENAAQAGTGACCSRPPARLR